MALGPTHYNWRSDVQEIVTGVLERFPTVSANTYVAHPWEGWDMQSVDFWGPFGRGDAINRETGRAVLAYLRMKPGAPFIRHHIYMHGLWTSFGGWSTWPSDDHSGELRHLHVTYW